MKIQDAIGSLLIVVSLSSGAAASVPCPAFLPACHTSVEGKKGPYLRRVNQAQLDAAAKLTGSDQGGRGLGNLSANGAGLWMPQTRARLTDLLQKLRAQWPYADPGNVVVEITGSTEYAARAFPDNSIVVSLGLLQRSASDDEVAWVIAHEYSHILLRHFARSAELERRKRMLDQIGDLAATAFAVSQERIQSGGGQAVRFYAVPDPLVQKRSDIAWSDGQQMRVLINLGSQAVSREQEDQADALGYDLATAAGFDAEDGEAHALDTISDEELHSATRMQSLSKDLQTLATESITQESANGVLSGQFGAAGVNFLKAFRANAMRWALNQMIAYMSDSHRAAAIRRRGLSDYASAAYPGAPDRTTKTSWLDAVRSNTEFREAISATDAHDRALLDMGKGDARQALKDLQPALTTRFSTAPFVLDEEARIYEGNGDPATADRLYDWAEAFVLRAAPSLAPGAPTSAVLPVAHLSSSSPHRTHRGGPATNPVVQPAVPSPAPKAIFTPAYLRQDVYGYADHIDLLASHGNYAKAKIKVAEAAGLLMSHKSLLPQMIYLDIKDSDSKSLGIDMAECMETEDESLRQRCRYAVIDPTQRESLDHLAPKQRADLDRLMSKQDDYARRLVELQGATPGSSATPKSGGP